MERVYLGLGTNLGNREGNLRSALGRIREKTGIISQTSSVYETSPWGFSSDKDFLNMAIEVETGLTPDFLIKELLTIESEMGRIRDSIQYKSRIIDIDILFYGDLKIDNLSLTIPHPHLHERKFVLVPLNEIVPGLIHPVFNISVASLLTACKDNSRVVRYSQRLNDL